AHNLFALMVQDESTTSAHPVLAAIASTRSVIPRPHEIGATRRKRNASYQNCNGRAAGFRIGILRLCPSAGGRGGAHFRGAHGGSGRGRRSGYAGGEAAKGREAGEAGEGVESGQKARQGAGEG